MIVVKKYSKNPIIKPLLNIENSQESCVYNPAAVAKNNKVYLLYRSEKGYENNAISKIDLAYSKDGFNFKIYDKNPVVKPELLQEKMGCEDPRILKIDNNRYFLTYTSYAGKDRKGNYKIKLTGAFSENLKSWEKIGTLLDDKKAGAIVENYKFNGFYAMYYQCKKTIKIAFSKNLKKWKIVEKPILLPRKGEFFDNYIVEPGPPPILIPQGILMIYNGKNLQHKFSVGAAIFDKNNPLRLLKRWVNPILEPTEYWEKFGKVNNVVFATGLIFFKNKWLLYYGGADKAIGVAEIKL